MGDNVEELAQALYDVKICDPAIGSGAFPMGLLKEIVEAVAALAAEDQPTVRRIWKYKGEFADNLAHIKEQIIENSIYGVDIEKGAVDIARLRFWLSLVVDENAPKPLPNLDYRIVVGNSLVSKFEDEIVEIDWNIKTKNASGVEKIVNDQQAKLHLLQVRQHEYFVAHAQKEKIRQNIRDLKIDILINQIQLSKISFQQANPVLGGYAPTTKEIQKNTENKIKIAGYDQLIQKLQRLKENKYAPLNYFAWKLDFPDVLNEKLVKDKVGFDIVIGNPPYVRQERLGQEYKHILKNRFPIIANGIADLYVYFFGIGLELLKEKGVLSYITLNKYLKTKYGLELRNLLAKEYDVDTIIDFFELPVFEASTDASITKVLASHGQRETKYYPVKTLENLNLFALTSGRHQKVIKDETEWKFVDNSQESLLNKISTNTVSLKAFSNDRIFRGITTGANHIFIIDENIKKQIVKFDPQSKKYIHPYVEPTKINQWNTPNTKKYIIGTFPSLSLDIDKLPGLKQYLKNFKKQLDPKPKNYSGNNWEGRKPGSYKWFEIQDNIAYNRFFTEPKIIYIHTAVKHQFYFDVEGRYINNSCYMIISDSQFLFCFLNSKLFEWFKKIKFVAYGDAEESGRAKLDYNKMITVPIRKVSKSLEQLFFNLVQDIKTKKSQGKNTKTLEQMIDNLIYSLYKLSYEEVKVIDPEFPLSKEEYEAIIIE